MKKAILLILAVFFVSAAQAQLNMSLISQYEYNAELNDIWGWADPDTGIEYALVGVQTGVSIVSLADPENPQEVAWIPGENSTWRDLKTYGEWCYVVTDQPGTTEGVTVIDLSDLPNSAPYYHWTPDLPGLGTIEHCHNLYIEEATGFCYLAGCNVNGGGILVIDVYSTPGAPQFVSVGTNNYAHDVYVRGDTIYSSEIYAGEMAIYDATDKQNVQFLGSQETPFAFTHNIWLSDDGSVAFTTDEQSNAPVGAYDISDPSNIQELDTYQPLETLGDGVIPHNVHVWNDWLIISYYTDGGIIVDAAQPDNLIEVGNFDTFFGGTGFNGAWGAYPFLPSGIVLITDIGNGLYVLDAEYKRACYLEGHVTSTYDGSNLSGVDVEIQSAQLNAATTDLLGEYKTGQVLDGSFEVTFTKPGYIPVTETVDLANGEITVLDVEMTPLGVIQGSVIRDADGDPVPGAQVVFSGDNNFYATADANGNFTIIGVEPGNYEVIAGSWGYITNGENMDINASSVVEMVLEEGYYDDFTFDFMWMTDGNVGSGEWEWVVPLESTYFGQISTPGYDVASDYLDRCYVTGNGGNGGSNDVDDGTTLLISPVMDLSDYNQPLLSYSTFFFNGGGNGDPNDAITFKVSNGIETVELESITETQTGWTVPMEFDLTGMLEFTDNMRMIVEISDLPGTGHIVEGAFDYFRVVEGNPTALNDPQLSEAAMEVIPNPASGPITVAYTLPEGLENAQLQVFDLSGQLIASYTINGADSQFTLPGKLSSGMYMIRLRSGRHLLSTQKAVQL